MIRSFSLIAAILLFVGISGAAVASAVDYSAETALGPGGVECLDWEVAEDFLDEPTSCAAFTEEEASLLDEGSEYYAIAITGPVNGNGNEVITAAACRAACESTGRFTSGICRLMCKGLKKAGCNGLWSWCGHLGRHTGNKQSVEACLATYNVICAGK
jgi:hypothetical protein